MTRKPHGESLRDVGNGKKERVKYEEEIHKV